MRIYSQWKKLDGFWGISVFTVYGSPEFYGVTILGFVIEFRRKTSERLAHQ